MRGNIAIGDADFDETSFKYIVGSFNSHTHSRYSNWNSNLNDIPNKIYPSRGLSSTFFNIYASSNLVTNITFTNLNFYKIFASTKVASPS